MSTGGFRATPEGSVDIKKAMNGCMCVCVKSTRTERKKTGGKRDRDSHNNLHGKETWLS